MSPTTMVMLTISLFLFPVLYLVIMLLAISWNQQTASEVTTAPTTTTNDCSAPELTHQQHPRSLSARLLHQRLAVMILDSS